MNIKINRKILKKKKKKMISSQIFHMENIELTHSRKFGTIKITRAVRFNEVTNFFARNESSPAIFQIENRPGLLSVKSSFPLRNFALKSQTRIFISRARLLEGYFSNTFFLSRRYLQISSVNCTRDPTSNFLFFRLS